MSICERPSNGIETCPTSAFGFEQCTVLPDRERLVYQAKKLKQTREAVQEKLEEYRQQYEQMEVRAIAAEAENQSLRLQKHDLESKLNQSEKSIQSMSGQLNTFRRATTEKGASLERFHSKLSEIRKAMTIEVEKLRQNERNLLQVLEDFRSKVTEFRRNSLSKDEFLSAVDTIFKQENELFKKDSNSDDHSPSPPPLPPKLISTTSIPADNKVVKAGEVKPAVPPRKQSLPFGLSSSSIENVPQQELNEQPRSPYRRNARVSNPIRGLYDLSTPNLPSAFSYLKTDPYNSKEDTDSSDDFEPFVPPRRKRYTSEHVPQVTPHRSFERNISSPIPRPQSFPEETSESIKKSSPILTKRPAWLGKKWFSFDSAGDQNMSQEKKALRKKIRSRSLDNSLVPALHKSLSEANIPTYPEGTGSNLVESGDETGSSTNNFEYVSSWKLRKAIGMEDGSAFSGSLPRLDTVGRCLSEVIEEDGEADLDCMYLNPDEIATFVSKKLDRTASKKVHKRLDTVLRTNNTYLRIIRSAPAPPLVDNQRVRPGALNVSSSIPTTKNNADTPTPYVHMASVTKMWEHIKDHDESQSMSGGYTSDDLSSVDWDADKSEDEKELRDEDELDDLPGNHYESISNMRDIKDLPDFDDERYAAAPGSIYSDHSIYAVIPDPPENDTTELPTAKLPSCADPDTWPSTQKKKGWRSRLLTPPTSRSSKPSNTLPRSADEAPYMRLNEAFNGEPESRTLRPPTPPPRPQKRTSFCPPPKSEFQPDNQLLVPGIGPLPLYTTQRGNQQQLQLVPLSALSPNISEDEHAPSDSERPSGHPYTLRRQNTPTGSIIKDNNTQDKAVLETSLPIPTADQTVPKRRVTHHVGTPNLASLVNDDKEEDTSSLTAPLKEKTHKKLSPQRSHTFSVPNSKSKAKQQKSLPVVEKSGFLNKMGPEKKRWTRRWFVLKGSELKYYRSKDQKRTRGVINLDSWCKLSRIGTPEGFQLATPKKIYHLIARNQQECEEWLKVLAAAMQHTTAVEGTDTYSPLKPKLPTVSGWAHITQNGQSEKLWCSLEGEMLNLSLNPGVQPHRKISVTQSTVRRKRDSILLDSGKQSRSNLNSVLFTIREKQSGGVTIVSPEKQEDKDSWFYYLSATQSGNQDLSLTMTEKLLTQILQDNSITHNTHPNWKHPVLNCTTGPLRNALTSLPSASLIAGAKNLFQSLQLFLTTPLNSSALEYHICSLQHMVGTCLKHTPLQDELYCQILRQISGHTSGNTSQVHQGWFLLYLIIHMFLPIKRKFEWYLKTLLERYASNSNKTLSMFAKQCQQAVIKVQGSGSRQCKPSYIELTSLLSVFAKSPAAPMKAIVVVPVYLADCSIIEVECTPSTTIQEFTSQLNNQIHLLDTSQTGFALMCDWPGMEDTSCCCPFPDSKLCDVMSMWSSSLEELSYVVSRFQAKQQRNINFTYKRRLCFDQRRGQETEEEAILLAHQMSMEILNSRHPVSSVEEGVQLAAIMAQIEYGDWTKVVAENENSGDIEREALQRFCPWRFTHLALEHDQSLLQNKLVKQWKELAGWTKNQCAHKYLSICYQWEYYGATLFQAEERFCCDKPRRTVWLAIHEKGVSLLEQNTLNCLQSYNYEEITMFGGNNEDNFMLVVSPLSHQLNQKLTAGMVQSEKLVFSMPQLKICEATFLIASYMEAFERAERSP